MANDIGFILKADSDPLFWPPSRSGVESAWYAHVPFAHWLVCNIRPRLLVELGTHNGVSYSAFCEAVARMRLSTACYAVDTWLGDQHSGLYGEEVYQDFARFNSARYASFSELLRCSFDDALPYFPDESVDLMHIDGCHTYESVKHDFESWMPKLSDRAVLLLHDTNVRERNFGAWSLFLELKQRYPAFEFLHGYGLGVVAIGAGVPAAVSALCSLDEGSISAVRERFAIIGDSCARAAAPLPGGLQGDEHKQSIKAMRDEISSLESRLAGFDSALKEQGVRISAVEAGFDSALKGQETRISAVEADLASLRDGVSRLSTSLDLRLARFFRKPVNFVEYDAAYEIWKAHKNKRFTREEAIQSIDEMCGVRSFFLMYPLYKIVRPIKRCKKFLVRKLGGFKKAINPGEFDPAWYLKTYPDVAASGIDPSIHYVKHGKAEGRLGLPPVIKIDRRQKLDPSKKTILIFSHEVSQTGAPIIAFNLVEKFARKYNVVSILLGPGRMEEAFRNASCATIGPLQANLRNTPAIHALILQACQEFSPKFAIVNSIESREAVVPLSEAGVPTVMLIHEFACLWPPELRIETFAARAGQIVFPARTVWEDAISLSPSFAVRPPNIIAQGPTRILREWLSGQSANHEDEHIASVMRPHGPDDGAVVIMGCGYGYIRKGIDLFISTAAILQRRLPSRRFRFVWVGKESEDIYPRYVAAQVERCGLQETVKFLGEVNSVAPAYAMADIFLLSSRLDPLPNVAIDAMLAGLPVICFEGASGIAEMLADHPDLNRLVAPYADPSSAAAIIEKLCSDDSLLRETKAAIKDLAVSSFDMDGYVERLEQQAETASLVSRQQEQDIATIKHSDVLKLEFAAPPWLCDNRDVFIKSMVREDAALRGGRCPFPGFHPGIYRSAHPELNEPPFANPLAHFIRSGHPKGPWLLDIISPDHSPSAGHSDQRVALHLHIGYTDLARELFEAALANRTRPDIFVTVKSDSGLSEVAKIAASLGVSIKDISIVPDRGRDAGAFLTVLGIRLLEEYEIVGHLHSKRSPHVPDITWNGSQVNVGAVWRSFCVENVLGGKHAMMDVTLDRFARNSKLGIVFPCDPNAIGWTFNRRHAEALVDRMGIALELPDEFFFPVGTMFWARTDAIAPLLELGLTWKDYPPEPIPPDGTILHAIERLFPLVAQHRGFEMAGTYVQGVSR